jgi:hypothetical protein
MNDARNARAPGRFNQHARVLNRILKACPRVREAHPVRVDERRGAMQNAPQLVGAVKNVGKNFDLATERIGSIGMVDQCDDLPTAPEQKSRRVFAGVAECPRDYNRSLHRRVSRSDRYFCMFRIAATKNLARLLPHFRPHPQELSHSPGR